MKKVFIHTLTSSIFLLPVLLSAQVGIKNPIGANDLGELIVSVIKAVRVVVIPFLVLAIMYTGWLFIAAQGKPDKIASARTGFFWVVVGILIVLSAEMIAVILSNTAKNLN